MSGSATLTAEMSRMTISCAMQQEDEQAEARSTEGVR